MRVVLVGPPGSRKRLLGRLPDSIEVVDQADSLSAARRLHTDVDAFLLAVTGWEDDFPLAETLTPREAEVLLLLADGLPNKSIAHALGVSDETVKFHLAAIFGKLGASNRTDAVRIAIRRGLVPL